ncbi:ABC transporter six-transmembrane domain-containing protein [Litoribacillus peritrichatus]|uniref:ABC transporter six-transmembrane domain-containing protein n=1 Tax=Litoribacillus peritrichatus TaxID=718191 RepID=A0ABP7N6A6_9GAMM
MQKISLKHIILRFKWRIAFTFFLIIAGASLNIFFPLVIGLAIDGLLAGSYEGIYHLGLLGGLTLVIGTAQRFYDTRIYAGIYCQIAPEMVSDGQSKGQPLSTISARSALLTEFVEFLENSLPEVVGAIIGVVGALLLIASLNFTVFLACLGLLLLIMVIYSVTGKFNYALNSGYNDQLEHQVIALESKNKDVVHRHFGALMRWNIKLSDLETSNYLVIWLGVIALLVFTPITVIDDGVLQYGLVFSLLMYVFEYIESLVTCPIFVQQLIRLHEISKRLSCDPVAINQSVELSNSRLN